MRALRVSLLAGLLALSGRPAGGAEAPVRRIDLGAGPPAPASEPTWFVRLGDTVLFAATTAAEGRELWRSDGPGDARLVLDLAPGQAGSDPAHLVVRGDRAYFAATGGRGRRVWVTDGTPAGTAPTSLFPDEDPESFEALGATPGRLTVVTRRAELWQSDGASPAVRVFERSARCTGSACGLVVHGARPEGLYVSAYGKGGPDELWRVGADGHAVELVEGLGRFVGEVPRGLLLAGVTGPLWIADADGARVLAPVDAEHGGSGDAAAIGGALLFAGRDEGGVELWRSDGTAEGTARVAELVPGPAGGEPYGFAQAAGRAFFLAGDGAGAQAIWTTDGTAGGTVQLARGFAAGAAPVPLGEAVVYTARVDGAVGLYRADAGGAVTLLSRLAADVPVLYPAGDRVCFAGDAGEGSEPWCTDGTAAGTRPLGAPGAGPAGAAPAELTALGPIAVFAADDGVHGPEPWRSDGTAGGTALLADLAPGPEGGAPHAFAAAGGRAWFVGSVDPARTAFDSPARLWSTDGTAAGTGVRDGPFARSPCNPGGAGPPCAAGPVPQGDRVVYQGGDRAGLPDELRTADAAGARRVGGVQHALSWATAWEDRLVWLDGDAAWMLRGDAVTALPFPTRAAELTPAPQGLFLVAEVERDVAGLYLWDGGPAAPAPLRRFPRQGGLAEVSGLAAAGGRLFLAAETDEAGAEPWTSDGTAGGTAALGDLRPGPAGSRPWGFRALRGGVVFFADDGAHGAEPWVSDGTPVGTRLVRDVHAGAAASVAPGTRLHPLPGGRAWFAASDGVHGAEPWVTDGTEAGTHLVVDLASGARSSSPGAPALLGALLLFAADAPGAGRQLIALDTGAIGPAPLPAPVAPGSAGQGTGAGGRSGCATAGRGGALGALLALALRARRHRRHQMTSPPSK